MTLDIRTPVVLRLSAVLIQFDTVSCPSRHGHELFAWA